MSGENFVRLRGFLAYPKLTQTSTGKHKFDGKIAVPITYKNKQGETINSRISYKISAWGDVAEALGEMAADTPITIVGHLNERAYDAKCEHCGGTIKRYWTDVQVQTFTLEIE